MHIHILGICGTFMGGIALLAREQGITVSGSDQNVYPPMSSQLQEAGITLMEGFDPAHLDPEPDLVVVGNALSRGNPAVEAMLNRGLAYTSGPAFLAEHVLKDRWVLAVAGTHGKTSTASMLAWILEYAKLAPGFLIGGVPRNFGLSARSGEAPFFVVEADEYDTAFFDKRSKFVHYHPRTLVMNNLEYDHADIFPDIQSIQRQFHHLVRTVPGNGLIIAPEDDAYLQEVIDMGCWTPVESIGSNGWQAKLLEADGSRFEVSFQDQIQGTVNWDQLGQHNVHNALAAIAAARHAGVPSKHALDALAEFQSPKRRMEVRGVINGITIYDDFAHHPTAIKTTLAGLRAKVGNQRILAVLEPRSNTMRLGIHKAALSDSLSGADEVWLYAGGTKHGQGLGWNPEDITRPLGAKAQTVADIDTLVAQLTESARPSDHILIMSNGGFGGLHQKLLQSLDEKHA